jgi:biofilm protein TabA
MILDTLAHADRYASTHKGFDVAFAFLRNSDLTALPTGRNELLGDWVYVMVIEGEGKGKDGAKLEAHRKYVDIQYMVSGTDAMGWKPIAACAQPESEFNEAKDCVLFTDPVDTWVDVAPGQFAIFFPEDAHAPMAGEGAMRKIVVKIAV